MAETATGSSKAKMASITSLQDWNIVILRCCCVVSFDCEHGKTKKFKNNRYVERAGRQRHDVRSEQDVYWLLRSTRSTSACRPKVLCATSPHISSPNHNARWIRVATLRRLCTCAERGSKREAKFV
jgi:hypothetical protein